MSPGASALLARAERAEVAADLDDGVPATLAADTAELLGSADLRGASPRALWNLLWLAGELSTRVDVYRAQALLEATGKLFERHLAAALTEHDELQAAADMAFDFFFNRADQPLASVRADAALEVLGRVLALDNRFCKRAALHGLGHLRQHAGEAARARVDALAGAVEDPTLAEYARAVREGSVL